MERFEVVPLEHRALVAYLQERGIPAHIATANCKEAQYSVNGKFYFAVAFENVSGGWELRYPNKNKIQTSSVKPILCSQFYI